MKAILTTICVGLSFVMMALDDISLRLNPSFYDEHSKTLYVDVELRYQGQGLFQLADQNYRLYYDSGILSLKEETSRSDLPQDLYSKLQFMEVLEGLSADNVNQLEFDDQLGFINFNIDLNDAADAGISIKSEDQWQRVAVLNFKVESKEALSQIVWSKSGRTDAYATAFVEVMEWVAPNNTQPASIEEMIDASFNTMDEGLYDVALTISPNPSVDFVKLDFSQTLDQDVQITIHDASGKEVKSLTGYRGADKANLSVTELYPGSYTVEVTDKRSNKRISQSSFIKVNK